VRGRGLIVAASHSGAGKTTVTLAILAALARRGIKVRAAKAGPDYIDPAFHAAATAAPGLNLDSWAMPPPLIDALMTETANATELFVIEGVMGLFDGVPGESGRTGATADLAARFRLPVLLVLDVAGQSQSAAAVARGFAAHAEAVAITGVVLNRVGSERHRMLVEGAMAAAGIPVLGALRRDAGLALPARHLGLVQASEHERLSAHLDRLAAAAERHLDLNAMIASAAVPSPPTAGLSTANKPLPLAPPGQRIALASDLAFTFMYPHVLDGWRRAGAEIVPFSPLADEAPPAHCDCCWLPGGYPELHAARLAAASRFKTALAQFAGRRTVHGECGGYMVLGEGLEDADGVRHAMTGLLGHATSFAKRKLSLGYRQARLFCDSALGAARESVRGHEFHYATTILPGNDEPLAELADAQGRSLGKCGGRRGRVTGTFFHAIAQA
jgi:cobyrinic acid a,c-diamide synthase